MKKTNNKKGFTLMEMLIVVAIIAILIAIAIPAFNSAMKKTRKSADEANLRSAYADAMVNMMEKTDGSSGVATSEAMQSKTGEVTLTVQGLTGGATTWGGYTQKQKVKVEVDVNGVASYSSIGS